MPRTLPGLTRQRFPAVGGGQAMYDLIAQTDPTAPPDLTSPFFWVNFGLLGVIFLMLISGKGLMTTQRHTEVRAADQERIAELKVDLAEWRQAYETEREARERESDARALAETRAEAAVEAARTVATALDAFRNELGRR